MVFSAFIGLLLLQLQGDCPAFTHFLFTWLFSGCPKNLMLKWCSSFTWQGFWVHKFSASPIGSQDEKVVWGSNPRMSNIKLAIWKTWRNWRLSLHFVDCHSSGHWNCLNSKYSYFFVFCGEYPGNKCILVFAYITFDNFLKTCETSCLHCKNFRGLRCMMVFQL